MGCNNLLAVNRSQSPRLNIVPSYGHIIQIKSTNNIRKLSPSPRYADDQANHNKRKNALF